MLPVPGEEEKDNPRLEMMNGSEQMVSDRQCDSVTDRQCDRQCDRKSALTVRQQTVCMTRDCHTASYDI